MLIGHLNPDGMLACFLSSMQREALLTKAMMHVTQLFNE